MKHSYRDALNRKLEALSPSVSEKLHALDEYPFAVQRDVIGTLLRHACESQNTANIAAARQALAEIPPSTLTTRLNEAIRSTVNLADEWEYRRLLELLRDHDPEVLATYVAMGVDSVDPDIREAAEDFLLAPTS